MPKAAPLPSPRIVPAATGVSHHGGLEPGRRNESRVPIAVKTAHLRCSGVGVFVGERSGKPEVKIIGNHQEVTERPPSIPAAARHTRRAGRAC